MAVINSSAFTITSLPITLAGAAAFDILQTTATVSVITNSGGGTLYAAIRTDRQWIAGEEGLIISASGDWADNLTTPAIGSNELSAIGLDVARTQYLGFVQSDGTNSSALLTGEFDTTAYPVGQEAPYQINNYPDRINYQSVPVHIDLMYSWGGDDPKSILVENLPSGLTADVSGLVSGIPTNVESKTISVTVQNGAGSSVTSFNWRTYSIETVAPAVEGMTRRELVDYCVAYADRASDIEITDNMDGIIRFAEDRMSRIMRNREMSARALFPLIEGTEYYDLPSDFAGFRDLNIQGGERPQQLHYLTPEQATRRSNYPVDGLFGYFTVVGNKLRILGAPGGDAEMVYFQRVPPLVEDGDSNWILVNHTDIYRNAVLAEMEAFAKNDGRAAEYDAILTRAFDEIAGRDWQDRWSGNPLQMRIE